MDISLSNSSNIPPSSLLPQQIIGRWIREVSQDWHLVALIAVTAYAVIAIAACHFMGLTLIKLHFILCAGASVEATRQYLRANTLQEKNNGLRLENRRLREALDQKGRDQVASSESDEDFERVEHKNNGTD